MVHNHKNYLWYICLCRSIYCLFWTQIISGTNFEQNNIFGLWFCIPYSLFSNFLQTSQFFFGSYGVGLATFIIIAVLNNGQFANYSQQAGLALAVGIIGGVLAVTLWCFLGIPILSAALPVALSGLLLGSCLVFLPAVNNITMSNDTFYWLLITAFIIGALLIILPFTKTASILSCALIGTFIFFVSIDHYVGTSLKFILVNFLRRAYVQNFNYAVLNFPFQVNSLNDENHLKSSIWDELW